MGISQNNNFRLLAIDLTDNTQINAGANRTEALTPPDGYIYEIIGIHVSSVNPVGSTSGAMYLYFIADYDDLAINMAMCFANFGNNLNIYYSTMICNGENPGNDQSQVLLFKGGLLASHEHPFGFKWDNQTDANKTGDRTLKILVKVYKEA